MAEWNKGIKLLLSSYRGSPVVITREKNSLSDFIRSLSIETHFSFLFKLPEYFDGEAFKDAPGGSTKGSNLQHYLNNLIFSPSRATGSIGDELPRILENDTLPLPLKDQYIAWKWFSESVGQLSSRLTHAQYQKYSQEWKSKSIPFLNPFEFLTWQPKLQIASSKSNQKISYDKKHPNLVVFGPPGTGKTRAAAVIARSVLAGKDPDLDPEKLNLAEPPKLTDDHKLMFFSTQFHPSFGYEDFFEGLRPVKNGSDDSGDITYKVVPGVFKVVCQLATCYLLPGAFGIDVSLKYSAEAKKWQIEDGTVQSLYRLNDRHGYFQYNGEIVAVSGGDSRETKESAFPTSSGVYTARWYYSGPIENVSFVLFIDELNRGNPAKVFGEALSLIEDGKRLGQSEETEIILPYSHDTFCVPPNLQIICAMNSSDKSLASLDHAFRRRFRFIYLAPAFEIVTTSEFRERSGGMFAEITLESLKNHFSCINLALKAINVPQENYIGHSYLINILRSTFAEERERKGKSSKDAIEDKVREKLGKVWENELHSLLREIVGDHKLEEFCQAFSEEIGKVKSSQGFLSTNADISRSLRSYLENIQPNVIRFPWKKAS